MYTNITEIGDSNSTYAPINVTDESSVKESIELVTKKWGKPLTCAVNCAGIAPPMKVLNRKGVPHDLQQFSNVMKVNTIGTFNVLRLAAESMSKNEDMDAVNTGCKGVIINTASIAAMDGQMGQAAYAASKGGILSLTRSG